jgi:hypothetical protein
VGVTPSGHDAAITWQKLLRAELDGAVNVFRQVQERRIVLERARVEHRMHLRERDVHLAHGRVQIRPARNSDSHGAVRLEAPAWCQQIRDRRQAVRCREHPALPHDGPPALVAFQRREDRPAIPANADGDMPRQQPRRCGPSEVHVRCCTTAGDSRPRVPSPVAAA